MSVVEPLLVQALCFKKGDVIVVTQKEDGGWWEGTFNEKTGWFPSNYVQEYKPTPDALSSPVKFSSPVKLPSDLALNMKANRALVVKDIIDSEKAYVTELQTLIHNFLVPIEKSEIMSKEQFQQLTSNLREILSLHETLLATLEASVQDQRLGRVFLQFAPDIKRVHYSYAHSHPRAACILDTFKDELTKVMEASGASSPGLLVLTTGLSKPLRRLDKYTGLLQELERHVDEAHVDRGDSQRCVSVYRDIQKELELEVLTGGVRGWEGEELSHLGEVLHMGSVAVGTSHQDRYFVLFPSTLLMLSVSSRMSAFIYEGKLPLTGIVVNRLDDCEAYKNAFQISGPLIDTILAICQTKDDLNLWIDKLSTQIRHNRAPGTLPHPSTPRPVPPPHHPALVSVAPYALLTAYFARLVRKKIITRLLLKRLLYREFMYRVDTSRVKKREKKRTPPQQHKNECMIYPEPCTQGGTESSEEEEEEDSVETTSSCSSFDYQQGALTRGKFLQAGGLGNAGQGGITRGNIHLDLSKITAEDNVSFRSPFAQHSVEMRSRFSEPILKSARSRMSSLLVGANSTSRLPGGSDAAGERLTHAASQHADGYSEPHSSLNLGAIESEAEGEVDPVTENINLSQISNNAEVRSIESNVDRKPSTDSSIVDLKPSTGSSNVDQTASQSHLFHSSVNLEIGSPLSSSSGSFVLDKSCDDNRVCHRCTPLKYEVQVPYYKVEYRRSDLSSDGSTVACSRCEGARSSCDRKVDSSRTPCDSEVDTSRTPCEEVDTSRTPCEEVDTSRTPCEVSSRTPYEVSPRTPCDIQEVSPSRSQFEGGEVNSRPLLEGGVNASRTSEGGISSRSTCDKPNSPSSSFDKEVRPPRSQSPSEGKVRDPSISSCACGSPCEGTTCREVCSVHGDQNVLGLHSCDSQTDGDQASLHFSDCEIDRDQIRSEFCEKLPGSELPYGEGLTNLDLPNNDVGLTVSPVHCDKEVPSLDLRSSEVEGLHTASGEMDGSELNTCDILCDKMLPSVNNILCAPEDASDCDMKPTRPDSSIQCDAEDICIQNNNKEISTMSDEDLPESCDNSIDYLYSKDTVNVKASSDGEKANSTELSDRGKRLSTAITNETSTKVPLNSDPTGSSMQSVKCPSCIECEERTNFRIEDIRLDDVCDNPTGELEGNSVTVNDDRRSTTVDEGDKMLSNNNSENLVSQFADITEIPNKDKTSTPPQDETVPPPTLFRENLPDSSSAEVPISPSCDIRPLSSREDVVLYKITKDEQLSSIQNESAVTLNYDTRPADPESSNMPSGCGDKFRNSLCEETCSDETIDTCASRPTCDTNLIPCPTSENERTSLQSNTMAFNEYETIPSNGNFGDILPSPLCDETCDDVAFDNCGTNLVPYPTSDSRPATPPQNEIMPSSGNRGDKIPSPLCEETCESFDPCDTNLITDLTYDISHNSAITRSISPPSDAMPRSGSPIASFCDIRPASPFRDSIPSSPVFRTPPSPFCDSPEERSSCSPPNDGKYASSENDRNSASPQNDRNSASRKLDACKDSVDPQNAGNSTKQEFEIGCPLPQAEGNDICPDEHFGNSASLHCDIVPAAAEYVRNSNSPYERLPTTSHYDMRPITPRYDLIPVHGERESPLKSADDETIALPYDSSDLCDNKPERHTSIQRFTLIDSKIAQCYQEQVENLDTFKMDDTCENHRDNVNSRGKYEHIGANTGLLDNQFGYEHHREDTTDGVHFDANGNPILSRQSAPFPPTSFGDERTVRECGREHFDGVPFPDREPFTGEPFDPPPYDGDEFSAPFAFDDNGNPLPPTLPKLSPCKHHHLHRFGYQFCTCSLRSSDSGLADIASPDNPSNSHCACTSSSLSTPYTSASSAVQLSVASQATTYRSEMYIHWWLKTKIPIASLLTPTPPEPPRRGGPPATPASPPGNESGK
ncbi:hypothetical protein M8J76_015239 [Diaphorina citri]|nr:hypothetical protein M8J76_015239 [Diaphorina citri]